MIAGGFTLAFDSMSAVTGPYAREILERRLGAAPGTVQNATPQNGNVVPATMCPGRRCKRWVSSDGRRR